MTGQIPPYGGNFTRVSLPFSRELANTAYVFKADPLWFIRSDKTSHKWWVFLRNEPASFTFAIPVSRVQRTLTLAMDLVLDGFQDGFYATQVPS